MEATPQNLEALFAKCLENNTETVMSATALLTKLMKHSKTMVALAAILAQSPSDLVWFFNFAFRITFHHFNHFRVVKVRQCTLGSA